MPRRVALVAVLLLIGVSCARRQPAASVASASALVAPPTEHWLDEDAEQRNKMERYTSAGMMG